MITNNPLFHLTLFQIDFFVKGNSSTLIFTFNVLKLFPINHKKSICTIHTRPFLIRIIFPVPVLFFFFFKQNETFIPIREHYDSTVATLGSNVPFLNITHLESNYSSQNSRCSFISLPFLYLKSS